MWISPADLRFIDFSILPETAILPRQHRLVLSLRAT